MRLQLWTVAPALANLFASVEVHLTPIAHPLFGALIANADRVLTQPCLLREAWGAATHSESTHYLRVYMGNLRQKLEDETAHPKHIVMETGVGYWLRID